MRKSYLIFSCLMLVSLTVFSQNKIRYRYEFIGGIGATGFLGDLGGASIMGTHLVKDYNFLATRYCANTGIRYKINPKLAIKSMLSFGMVSGNDAFSHDVIRNNRNLNFRSPIIELCVQAEYYILTENSKNKFTPSGFKLKKIKSLAVYVFTGIGVFYYNPQEKLGDKNWYTVRQYHVEGQGLPGGPKQFSNFSVAIPLGIGVRKKLNNRWSIGTEFVARKTFTDYIDGVSGTYYDKAKLTQAYGSIAAALADPNLGKIDGATMTGQKRGNSTYKDSYMFVTINIGYKITQKRHHKPRH